MLVSVCVSVSVSVCVCDCVFVSVCVCVSVFVCVQVGHFAKDCRRKETAQCSKCGEKGHLDRECKRQRDEGKHEPVAMGSILASPDEEYWAVLIQWKTSGMLVDSGCTDHIVTIIDAFLDFVPIQSVVKNPNGEAYRVVGRGCV